MDILHIGHDVWQEIWLFEQGASNNQQANFYFPCMRLSNAKSKIIYVY